MKLVRYGAAGDEKPGLIDDRGHIRDLSAVISDLSGPFLSRASLDRIQAIDFSSLPLVDRNARIGACVGKVGHFIAVGLNYVDHARETNTAIPDEPVLFSKAPSSICGPADDLIIPRGSTKLDWEVELAVVLGQDTYDIDEDLAPTVIAGYCVCNDVSERAFQLEAAGQWIKGKSAPTFGPLGPWLVTPDEIDDVQNMTMWLTVGGQKRQHSSTQAMIFSVDRLISYISRFMKLEAGDVIATGTPAGVGLGMTPPVFLSSGDFVELGIEGLGVQRHRVVNHVAI